MEDNKYKILTISGGGSKGYFSLQILKEIERVTGKRAKDCFDLIVGTSVGAFITAMCENYSAQEMDDLFINKVRKEIFKPNPFSFYGVMNSLYQTTNKIKVIKDLLQDIKPSYDYVIPAYDTINRRPVLFNSLENNHNGFYMTTEYDIADAVCASTSAPLMWDPYCLDNMILLDGAFVSNDPSALGIKLALEGTRELKDIILITIGTGLPTKKYKYKNGGSYSKWALPSMYLMMENQSQLVDLLYTDEDLEFINLDTKLVHGSDAIDNITDKNLENLKKDAHYVIKHQASDLIRIKEIFS